MYRLLSCANAPTPNQIGIQLPYQVQCRTAETSRRHPSKSWEALGGRGFPTQKAELPQRIRLGRWKIHPRKSPGQSGARGQRKGSFLRSLAGSSGARAGPIVRLQGSERLCRAATSPVSNHPRASLLPCILDWILGLLFLACVFHQLTTSPHLAIAGPVFSFIESFALLLSPCALLLRLLTENPYRVECRDEAISPRCFPISQPSWR